jgi:DNA-binding GntR family transcriptional regulator
LSNRLFDHPDALSILNNAHEDVLTAIAERDGAAVRRGIERDLRAAGQILRASCKQAAFHAQRQARRVST